LKKRNFAAKAQLMIIYNVTVKIEIRTHDEWLAWMKETHIPDVMATGFFVDHRMMRILEQDERDGITYAIQYRCLEMSTLLKYQNEKAEALQKEHTEKFKDKFVAFRTIMREVD
jgi:hypothetical protein